MRRAAQSLRAIFAAPVFLAILSLLGLAVALAGDGMPDVLSWIALSTPVLAAGWAMRWRRS